MTKQRNTAIETKKLKIIIEGKSASKKKEIKITLHMQHIEKIHENTEEWVREREKKERKTETEGDDQTNSNASKFSEQSVKIQQDFW